MTPTNGVMLVVDYFRTDEKCLGGNDWWDCLARICLRRTAGGVIRSVRSIAAVRVTQQIEASSNASPAALKVCLSSRALHVCVVGSSSATFRGGK